MKNEIQKRISFEFVTYFLKLGTLGFGGPIALANYMLRDLVEKRKWISQEDYNEGLAFAKISPGPLATQLAMYLGWVQGGRLGATLTGIAFIFPSFLMVTLFAVSYFKFGNFQWLQAVFHRINPVVIGIIAKSAYQLTRKTLERDFFLWILFFVSSLYTVWTGSESLWLFPICGIISILVKAPPQILSKKNTISLVPIFLINGIHGPASLGTIGQLFLYFAKMGAVVFGSGLAIVPFMHTGVVQKFHWLSEKQFLDAVSIGMVTPGPILITSAFIGYLVAGILGALSAAIGVFLPCYLFIIVLSPHYRRFAKNPQIKAFVNGVTATAIGGIAGGAFILAQHAITDLSTSIIALVSLFLLLVTDKLPEPLLILLAAAVGLFWK